MIGCNLCLYFTLDLLGAMDKDKQIQKNIVSYYKYLQEHKNKWHSLTEQSLSIVTALSNQMEQYTLSKRFNITGTDFSQFPFIKDRILSKLCNGIEDEIAALQNIILQLLASNQNLKNKSFLAEQNTSSLNWSEGSSNMLVKGSAFQYPLEEVLEWVYKIETLHRNRLSNIQDKFSKIRYGDMKSIDDLRTAFNRDESLDNYLQRTLTFMQFCEKVDLTG